MNANKRPEKDCETCGKHFVCVRPKQRFCSKKCIRTGRSHLICPCGINTGSYQKKYCCPEHREKWGKKKAPTRMVTHTCLACGKDFERPYWYPNKNRYCSNRCSHAQQKKVRDKYVLSLNEHAVVFHSGWEVRFWAACERFSVPIRSYDGPDIETSLGNYRPDFVITLPSGEQIVDVKGWYRPESFVKITEANERGYDVMLVPKITLLQMESEGIQAGFPVAVM